MSGVAVPARRDTGLLSTVMKGLSIANDVYGIRANAAKLDEMDESRKRQIEADATAKSEKERVARGEMTQGEFNGLLTSGKVQPADKGAPGAFGIPVQTNEGPVLAFVTQAGKGPLVKATDPIAQRKLELDEKRFAYQQEKDKADRQAKASGEAGKPAGGSKPLNAEERKRLDSASMGLAAVKDMGDALSSGTNTFSLIGDNDFTAARTRFEEAIGRMQSGGAISNDEAKRFAQMAPTFTDSAEMQQKKMANLYREMSLRIESLGANPDELLAKRTQTQVPEFGSSTEGQAIAAPAPKPGTVEDGHRFLGGDPSDPKSWQPVGGK